ncbi:MAG: hypothetical protein H0W46_04290 [Acidimicrobiia bacterium]|nr:hypothetical protein [Acidimicrobiia bacterium]
MALIEHRRTGDIAHVRLNRPERQRAGAGDVAAAGPAGRRTRRRHDGALRFIAGEGDSFGSGIDRRAPAAGGLTPVALTGDEADRERTEYAERDIVAAQATARWLPEVELGGQGDPPGPTRSSRVSAA